MASVAYPAARRRPPARAVLGKIVAALMALAICLSVLFPLAWMAIAGFKGRTEVLRSPFQFFPDTLAGLAAKPPEAREVARLPGYLNPDDFLTLFRFVREKAYETKSFRDYVRAARG